MRAERRVPVGKRLTPWSRLLGIESAALSGMTKYIDTSIAAIMVLFFVLAFFHC
jgi:hypothetical protein